MEDIHPDTMVIQTIVHYLARDWGRMPSFHTVVEKTAHVCFLSPDKAHDVVVEALRHPDEKVFGVGEVITEIGRVPCAVRDLPEERVPGVDWNTVTCCYRHEDHDELESYYFGLRDLVLYKLNGQLSEEKSRLHDAQVERKQLAAQLSEWEVDGQAGSEVDQW